MSSRRFMGNVLVVDHAPDVALEIETALAAEGHRVHTVHDGKEAITAAAALRPDLVLLDIVLPSMSGLEVARALRADPVTSRPAIIFLAAAADERITAFEEGADDFVTKPYTVDELVVRVQAALRRAEDLRGLSPLTGLPGNVEITRSLERELAAGDQRFALVWADLDNFKSFNDHYGFLRGDEAIRTTAHLLCEEICRLDRNPRFIGHLGGDDFVLLVSNLEVHRLAERVVNAFDVMAPRLYDPHDRARGFIEVRTRPGTIQQVPILTISMGIATSSHRRFALPQEVVDVAKETKRWAKARRNSAWRVDERHPLVDGPPSAPW